MKKYIPLIFVTIFPYMPFVLLLFNGQTNLIIICAITMFLFAVVSSALHFIFSMRNKWNSKTLSLINMLIKLIHMPAYILLFVIGASGLLFIHFLAVTFLIFIFDCVTIALSGIVALSATLRAKTENKLKAGSMVVLSVSSFVFCIDVIASIVLFLNIRSKNKLTSREKQYEV